MAEIQFKCSLNKLRYKSENYKIYVVDCEDKAIKTNKSNEVILVGDILELLPNQIYSVKANIEINKKFGIQYKVVSIKQNKPTDLDGAKTFLSEVTTPKQAEAILSIYPDIIDKVINNDLENIDLSKTKGIKEYTFNKIKEAIINNFALLDIVALFKNYISINVIRKLYEQYHSVEYIIEKLNDSPYRCLCNISGIGFKSADAILLQLEKLSKNELDSKFKFSENLITSYQRMAACIDFILTENEQNGNTRMPIKDLRQRCHELTPECISKFVEVMKMNKETIYVDEESKTVSRKITYNSEVYISDIIKEMLNKNNNWNVQTELYRNDSEIKLTDEQMNVLSNCCKYNVSLLTAPAGSGKSQSIKNVINMLEDNNKSYLLCTPTGKSSEVLADYCGREAGTVHRQYKYNPKNNDSPWGYNLKNKLDVDVVVIDEFGMIDVFLMKHILEGIDTSKTKLILVFDSYQLSSIGCGNIAHDLLTSNKIPTTYLTKIFRYNEGGLMQVATKIRNSESFLLNDFSGVKIFGTKRDFIFNEVQQEKIVHQIVAIYNKLLDQKYSLQDIMILSCQNKGNYGTKIINKAIQMLIQKNKNNNFIMRGEDRFFKDDKVIQITNNYKALDIEGEETEVYNGNTGIIIDVNYNNLTVDFGKGKLIVYEKSELNQLELGYCISIHKSQGDSAKQVIVVAPKAHTFMLNSNLLYVGVTRAKERCFLLGNIITINRAIKKKENLTRNTFLKTLLQEENSLE